MVSRGSGTVFLPILLVQTEQVQAYYGGACFLSLLLLPPPCRRGETVGSSFGPSPGCEAIVTKLQVADACQVGPVSGTH